MKSYRQRLDALNIRPFDVDSDHYGNMTRLYYDDGDYIWTAELLAVIAIYEDEIARLNKAIEDTL